MNGDSMERRFRKLNATTKDVIENIVIDWMNKYPLTDGNLAVKDFDNPEAVRGWVTGVWGRISHQLSQSGLKYDNNSVLSQAGKSFYEQVSHLATYERIRPHLPAFVTMHDPSTRKPPDAPSIEV